MVSALAAGLLGSSAEVNSRNAGITLKRMLLVCMLSRQLHASRAAGPWRAQRKEETNRSERECFLCIYVPKSWISMLCSRFALQLLAEANKSTMIVPRPHFGTKRIKQTRCLCNACEASYCTHLPQNSLRLEIAPSRAHTHWHARWWRCSSWRVASLQNFCFIFCAVPRVTVKCRHKPMA